MDGVWRLFEYHSGPFEDHRLLPGRETAMITYLKLGLISVLLCAGCDSEDAEGSPLDSGAGAAGEAGVEASVPEAQAEDSNGEASPQDAANDTASACSPLVGGKCSPGPNNTLCCAFQGDVFLWSTTATCRKRVHSATDSLPYDCMDTGAPSDPQMACMAYTAEACYQRDTGSGDSEVMLSPVRWPDSALAGSDWHVCPDGLSAQVEAAEDCP